MKKLSKRLMSGVLATMMAIAPIAPYDLIKKEDAFAATTETYTDGNGIEWQYTSNGTSIIITGALKTASVTELIIPDEINGISVTGISDAALCTGQPF